MAPKNILIVAGEPSGDLYASNLVKDLKALEPGLNFFGLGGNLMKNAGVDIIFDMKELALIGATEVLKNLSKIKKAQRSLFDRIDSGKTDLAILVDYPGFNLRLAGQLKKRNIPVAYYISPQIWAWGFGRIRIIKEAVKKMVVFFRFEEELYKRHGVNAEFVGHPLLDIVKPGLSKEEFIKKYGLSKERLKVALLPGSRKMEIENLLPALLSACEILNSHFKGRIEFIIAKEKNLSPGLYEHTIKDFGIKATIADGETYDVLNVSDFAIVASGTATLETAIIGTPLIIVYKTSFITSMLYYLVRRVPYLGLVNIIAGRELAPELLQSKVTPEKIARAALEIMTDEEKMTAMRRELGLIKDSLGSPGASLRAAKAILPLVK